MYYPSASAISSDNLNLGLLGEYLKIHPPWENTVASKIRNMKVTEQGLALDTICHFLDKHSQVGSGRLMLPTGWKIHGAREEVKAPSRTHSKSLC